MNEPRQCDSRSAASKSCFSLLRVLRLASKPRSKIVGLLVCVYVNRGGYGGTRLVWALYLNSGGYAVTEQEWFGHAADIRGGACWQL